MGRAQRCPDSLIVFASSIFGAFSRVHVPWPDSLERDGGAFSSSCDGPVAHDAGRTPRGPRFEFMDRFRASRHATQLHIDQCIHVKKNEHGNVKTKHKSIKYCDWRFIIDIR